MKKIKSAITKGSKMIDSQTSKENDQDCTSKNNMDRD
jgi:hypothetical protein